MDAYLTCDDNLQAVESLTDEEILKEVRNEDPTDEAQESADDENQSEPTAPVTSSQALACISSLRQHFLRVMPTDDPSMNYLDQLENSILSIKCKNVKQVTIFDYFKKT